MDYKATLNMPKSGFPMRAGLPKREPEMLKHWEEMDLYNVMLKKNEGKPRFALHDGPPFSNGGLHMGHALNKSLKDFITRSYAMRGYYTPYIPGWDNHGMPIESAIIKEQKLNRKAMSVPEFRSACHAYAQHYVDVQSEGFQRMGVLGDWEHPYCTMNPGFEAEFGITLFERSHSGVKVTPAGALLVDDARSIMRQSEDALRRARRAAGDGDAVRLGVSMMCPGRQTLSMWTGVHELEPSLRFEIVPVSDLYDERETVMRSLGREVDVVQSSFSTPRWGDACQKLRIVNVPFYIDLPRTSPLARKTRITVADLEGMRLRVLRHGNDAMDSLRIDLLADGGVDVIDVDSFDFALFNEAEEKGDAVLTCGAWSGVHPAFVGVPFLCGREVPVFLHYPLEPTLQVQKFVNAMAQLLK